jgi:hypothetical protein
LALICNDPSIACFEIVVHGVYLCDCLAAQDDDVMALDGAENDYNQLFNMVNHINSVRVPPRSFRRIILVYLPSRTHDANTSDRKTAVKGMQVELISPLCCPCASSPYSGAFQASRNCLIGARFALSAFVPRVPRVSACACEFLTWMYHVHVPTCWSFDADIGACLLHDARHTHTHTHTHTDIHMHTCIRCSYTCSHQSWIWRDPLHDP